MLLSTTPPITDIYADHRAPERAVATPVVATPRVSLVVPCFNGGARLERTLQQITVWLASVGHETEVILSDDGSDSADAQLLARFAAVTPGVRVVRSAQNRGKGHAIARAMLAARGTYCIFTDSDLAYPLDQIERIVHSLESGADVVIANRLLPESEYQMSPRFIPYLFSRHVGSRIFNGIVRMLLVPGLHDTQAGLKGFSAGAAATIASRLTVPGFAFDVEALVIARIHCYEIAEVPVRFRYDSEPSTVHYLRDTWRMLRDISRVRWLSVTGRYA